MPAARSGLGQVHHHLLGLQGLVTHTHQWLTPGPCVQVHYRGLRVLLAWRDAQGGCSPPSYPNLSLPPHLEASLLNSTATF